MRRGRAEHVVDPGFVFGTKRLHQPIQPAAINIAALRIDAPPRDQTGEHRRGPPRVTGALEHVRAARQDLLAGGQQFQGDLDLALHTLRERAPLEHRIEILREENRRLAAELLLGF